MLFQDSLVYPNCIAACLTSSLIDSQLLADGVTRLPFLAGLANLFLTLPILRPRFLLTTVSGSTISVFSTSTPAGNISVIICFSLSVSLSYWIFTSVNGTEPTSSRIGLESLYSLPLASSWFPSLTSYLVFPSLNPTGAG